MIDRNIDLYNVPGWNERKDMPKIDQYIFNLKYWQNEITKTLEELERAKQLYPDVTVHTNRWGFKRLCSASVNAEVDQHEDGFNCGCCEDSGFEVWPYKEVDGMKIFASNIPYCIGEKCGVGIAPGADWGKKLVENNINPKIIEQLRQYLKDNPPDYGIGYDCEDEQWEIDYDNE